MGCWNSTCGISNLPIFNGEAIRGALIVGRNYKIGENLVRSPRTWKPDVQLEWVDEEGNKHEYADKEGKRTLVPESILAKEKNDAWRNGWWSGLCYADDVFFPRCVALKGKYDDYGGIDKLKAGLNQKVIADQFMLDLDEYPAGIYNIPKEVKRGMPLQDLLEGVERGGVTVNRFKDTRLQGSMPVGLWMVREDIYQAVLSTTVGDRGLNTLSLQMFLNAMGDYRDGLTERAKDEKLMYKLLSSSDNPEVRCMSFSSMMNRGSTNALCRAMHEPPFENGIAYYDEWILKQVGDGELDPNSKELEDLLIEIAEFSFFCIAKDSMRIAWMPQPGKGSQDSRIEVHAAVAKQVLKTVELMRAEREE